LSYRASTCRTNNAVEVSSVKKSEAVGQITGKPDRALDNDVPNAVTGGSVEHLWLTHPYSTLAGIFATDINGCAIWSSS
jgi:hypothetical protein